jgi:deoxyribonuclease-4
MNLGAHMSIAGGIHTALDRGRSIRCNAVQLFVKNRNQWRMRRLAKGEIAAFRAAREDFKPEFVLAHAIYLVNLASPEPEILKKSRRGFLEEMRRAERLGISYIVLHPGSHKGAGEAAGIRTIIQNLDYLFEKTAVARLTVLLETTAGQGNSIGHTFEQLAAIIEGVNERDRVGVCFDTCHAFAAGYDLRSKRAYKDTFRHFDDVIGLENLRAFHLNDSIRELGSRVDRHTHIGKGAMGLQAFSHIVNDERFFDRPMILETPKGPDMKEDIKNLRILRSLRKAKKARPKRRRGDKS